MSARGSLGLFNHKKEEELVEIESPDGIYAHADRIRTTITSHIQRPEPFVRGEALQPACLP